MVTTQDTPEPEVWEAPKRVDNMDAALRTWGCNAGLYGAGCIWDGGCGWVPPRTGWVVEMGVLGVLWGLQVA